MGFQLRQNNVLPALNVNNRKEALRIMIQHTANQTGVAGGDIHEALLLEESIAVSGIGEGVAIPHARVKGLEEPYLLFARLNTPIEFNAVDGKPVDLIVILLSPNTESEPYHLRRLARLTRMMRDQDFASRLRGTDQPEALYVQLLDPMQKSLAA